MSTTGDAGGGEENEKSDARSPSAAASPAPAPKAKAREKEERRVERGPAELSAPRAILSAREMPPGARSTKGDKEKDRTGRRQKRPSSGAVPNAGLSARGEKSRNSNEPPKVAFKFTTPPGETELSSLPLDKDLAAAAKMMEEYKVAITQIFNTLVLMVRRGNGTTDDTVKSEKGNAMVEKLAKDVYLTQNFWNGDKKQPDLNKVIAANSEQLAEVERNLQEHAPFHLLRIKKFLLFYWPRWVDLKKDMAKAVSKRPDSKDSYQKQMRVFLKERYMANKSVHLAEIQCCLAELSVYHRCAAMGWYQIAEKKQALPISLMPSEKLDFTQFLRPGTEKSAVNQK